MSTLLNVLAHIGAALVGLWIAAFLIKRMKKRNDEAAERWLARRG